MAGDSDAETTGRHLVYFAAERTLLSWLRAAVAVMALGFLIDRFGLLMHESMPGKVSNLLPRAVSFGSGTFLVLSGVLMTVMASVRYGRFAARYQREGSTEPGRGLSMAIAMAVLVGVAGILIGVFLVTLAR